jgi:hypothetical protein
MIAVLPKPADRRDMAAAAVGLAAVVAGIILSAADALHAYRGAALAFLSLPVGALVLLFMMDVMGGAWREKLGPPTRAVARLLPAAALLFVPALVGILLDTAARTPAPDWTAFRSAYLSAWFVALRTVAYFALWLWLLGRALRGPGAAGFGAAALIALTITITLASVDWAMSLDRDFSSSIYGLIFLSHVVLSGLGGALILYALSRQEPHPMLGALLVTCILMWAYMHAMQFIIIWAGNRSEDVAWYVVRSRGLWLAVLVLVGIAGFCLPFAALLAPGNRTTPQNVANISAIVLGAMILECFWLAVPGHAGHPIAAILGAAGGLLLCAGPARGTWRSATVAP